MSQTLSGRSLQVGWHQSLFWDFTYHFYSSGETGWLTHQNLWEVIRKVELGFLLTFKVGKWQTTGQHLNKRSAAYKEKLSTQEQTSSGRRHPAELFSLPPILEVFKIQWNKVLSSSLNRLKVTLIWIGGWSRDLRTLPGLSFNPMKSKQKSSWGEVYLYGRERGKQGKKTKSHYL